MQCCGTCGPGCRMNTYKWDSTLTTYRNDDGTESLGHEYARKFVPLQDYLRIYYTDGACEAILKLHFLDLPAIIGTRSINGIATVYNEQEQFPDLSI